MTFSPRGRSPRPFPSPSSGSERSGPEAARLENLTLLLAKVVLAEFFVVTAVAYSTSLLYYLVVFRGIALYRGLRFGGALHRHPGLAGIARLPAIRHTPSAATPPFFVERPRRGRPRILVLPVDAIPAEGDGRVFARHIRYSIRRRGARRSQCAGPRLFFDSDRDRGRPRPSSPHRIDRQQSELCRHPGPVERGRHSDRAVAAVSRQSQIAGAMAPRPRSTATSSGR